MRGYRQHLGPKFNEGARLMWLRLQERGWNGEDLTRAAGWGRGMAHKYMFGDAKPGRRSSQTLQMLLDISPAAFDRPPSASFVPPVAQEEDAEPLEVLRETDHVVHAPRVASERRSAQ